MTHNPLEADLRARNTMPSPSHQPGTENRSSNDTGTGNRHPVADYPLKPRYFPTGCGECAGCGKWWAGLNTAHCTACHRTFTAVSTFDKHRTGNHAHDTRHCVDPATVGLVDAGRAYPCWAQPGTRPDFGGDDAA